MKLKKIIFGSYCIFSLLNALENPSSKIVPSTLKTLAIAGALKAFYTDDGRYLVVDTHNSVGNSIAVRNTDNYEGGIDISIPPTSSITTISPDNYAITSDFINPLVKWNIHTGQHEALSKLTRGAARARYDKSGQRLVFTEGGAIFLLDLKSNKIVKEIRDYKGPIGLAWNPIENDQIGISCTRQNSDDTEWGVWDLIADKVRKVATVKPLLTSMIQFNNNGDVIVCGARDQFIQCDTKTGLLTYYSLNGQKRDWPFPSQNNPLYSAAVVPGAGTALYAGSEHNRVVYCDMKAVSQSLIFNPSPHNTSNVIHAVAIHPSGKQMAVGTVDDKNESVVKILSLCEC